MAITQKQWKAALLLMTALMGPVLTGCSKGTTPAPAASGAGAAANDPNASNMIKQQAAQQQQMAQHAQQMQQQSHPVTQPIGQATH